MDKDIQRAILEILENVTKEEQTTPIVPQDIVGLGKSAASMPHSLFYSVRVREAVCKAYKKGFEAGLMGRD